MTNVYDSLGRISRRIYPDNGTEAYVYDSRGLAYYTNALNKVTQYQFDAAGRKTNEVTAKSETIQYTYNAAGQLLTLRDDRSKYTRWEYDTEGRLLVKKDHNQAKTQTNSYNANGWQVKRWSPAKGLTQYDYNKIGSLTNVNYPSSTDIVLQRDALGRVTNQVDAAGTTRYTYNALGQLRTEDSPWSNDTITYDYHATIPRRLTGLTLQQPSGSWAQTYGYDTAGRVQTVVSPAGTFTYGYKGALTLCTNLALPNSAAITNDYDNVARLSGTWLKIGSGIANKHIYQYNLGGQRYRQTRSDDSYVNYTYDSGGQLESALGYSYNGTPIASEQLGYRYDSGWNLYQRTNNGAVTQFGVDSLNQLNAGPSGTYGYDGNGNWTTDGANRTYQYDDENQLTTATYTATFQTQLTYDARMRLRQRREYNWQNGTWTLANTINYIYDGMRTIETRATTGTATYTRGLDLSGSMKGAGGVGGMLARTVGAAHYYYHADGNGNITKLIDANQASVASYKYDSFGKTLSSSGSEAANNPFRFSSKEYRDNSGFYYFGYRWYDPNHQRWPNRDPIGEFADINLYRFNYNNPVNYADPNGRWGIQFGSINFGIGDPNLAFDRDSWGDLGHGAAATIDGFVPFGDPLANKLKLYNPCDRWLRGSQFIGSVWRDASLAAVGGAIVESALGVTAYSQLSWGEKLLVNRNWVSAVVENSVSPTMATVYQGAFLTANTANLWDVGANLHNLLKP